MRAANSYAEACAIMRMVSYGSRAHRAALQLTRHATLRNDSQWLREKVRRNQEPVRWVVGYGGIPSRITSMEGERV